MPDLERIQQNTPGTLSQQWYEDGVAVDPGTVTIGIARADGSVLVAPATATTGSGTAARTFNLTTTHTALLDRLTVTWTSTLKGTLVSYVEVVGGFLFSISEARALKPLDQTAVYSTAAIVDMRTTVEQALEEECGVAFVPRYTRETVNGTGTTSLLLRWPKVTAIRSATVGTTVLGVSDLAALTYGAGGVINGYSWTAGIGNLTVGYEHGYTSPPAEIKRAALLLAKIWLTSQARPIDDRAITFNAGADGGTYSLAVPGRNGSAFGHPDVDVAVQRYGMAVGVA